MPRSALLLTLALLLPAAAQAAPGLAGFYTSLRDLHKQFDAADRNHDGLLTREEAENGHIAFIVNNFDHMDRQHRGAVSKQDVDAFIKARIDKHVEKAEEAKPAEGSQ